MHIEKNVFDNVVVTLLNDSSNKCKDNLKARKDLQLWGIRPDLWPDENGKYLSTIYTLTNVNKDIFLKTLKNILFQMVTLVTLAYALMSNNVSLED